jgi:hypothetical protein
LPWTAVPGPHVTAGAAGAFVFEPDWEQPLQPDRASAPKEAATRTINDRLFMSILPKRSLEH